MSNLPARRLHAETLGRAERHLVKLNGLRRVAHAQVRRHAAEAFGDGVHCFLCHVSLLCSYESDREIQIDAKLTIVILAQSEEFLFQTGKGKRFLSFHFFALAQGILVTLLLSLYTATIPFRFLKSGILALTAYLVLHVSAAH